MTTYRNLSEIEITTLKKQNCNAEDWSEILVHPEFEALYVNHTRFSGKIKLGILQTEYVFEGGLKRPSSINNATLHNCEIGDNVYINNVHSHIANYRIGNNVRIENIGLMYVDGDSTFGNGLEISVLSEVGGREVIIYNELSAHLAYIMAFGKYRHALISKIKKMVQAYTEGKTSNIGTIEDNARISNTALIKNVCIGDNAIIEGATHLENGTINSNKYDPVYIGDGVTASDFIITSGSHINDGTKLNRCFVGQACHFGGGYSASNSLFFSNCHAENGEASAIFAGPYTVTHHKSTLLIGGMFSFMNAGSGTNQSNHMYKLGAMHFGLMERGSKTGSNSYIKWPAKIGAFSFVTGNHICHPDTSKLPFSYLIGTNNESILIPGINLKSVGTIRDSEKFPERDNRKDVCKLDQINFRLLSPYSVQKLLQATHILNELKDKFTEATDYEYQNCKIQKSSLERALCYYQMGIIKYLGSTIIKRLNKCTFSNIEEVRTHLKPDINIGKDNWCDLAGLITPYSEIEKIICNIEDGTVSDLQKINDTFIHLHKNYNSYEWMWTWNTAEKYFKISLECITANDIISIINRWKKAINELDELICEDAKKENTLQSLISFELDESIDIKVQIENDFEKDSFIKRLIKHSKEEHSLADLTIERLKEL